MKRREPQPLRIEALRDERGSMALEASIVLPVFLFALLLLIFMIRLAALQMALQDAASQASRLTAAHIRPAALAAGGAAGSLPALPQLPLGDIGPLAAELARRLPEPAGPLVAAALEGDWKPVREAAATPLAATVFEPLARELAESSVLSAERVSLHSLSLPDLQQREEPYVRLVLAYEIPLGLPFTKRYIRITASAEERVWIGDPRPSSAADAEKQNRSAITLLSLEPSPLRPGRKARLVAAAAPGETVSLQVRYKSGNSRAKHVGDATVGADGLVSWEWLVSGNTTPGTWELTVTGRVGTSASMHFVVEKKGGGVP
ncbi:MAG TPA: TadE/TadG family type IV pilus assembly protein [Paenibacillus sp.]|uniref:TadE/TadG family type IV pilus assembly protein n=1 Tax=Paenibacillus sp. TaxID=58172 RepID=UPI0028D278B5|nr:TadE/TadG family type IV pilus assembly protein [Paenibacillus sp.]HUC91585.1 TadE/TadG family type IV pilus assembly protein [Paenibacillus sp.]